MLSDTINTLFDDIVRRLHEDPDKPLVHYGSDHPVHKKALGSPIDQTYHLEKKWNFTDKHRKSPGMICYLGDQSYTRNLVPEQFFATPHGVDKPLPQPTPEHVVLNRKSVTGALSKYVREEEFGQFLTYVLQDSGHTISRHVLDQVTDLITLEHESDEGPISKKDEHQDIPHCSSIAHLRKNIARSEIMKGQVGKKFLKQHPVLIASIVTLLCAQAEFLVRLKSAIDRADYLLDDERDIATDVVLHSFNDFRLNLTLNTLLPLTVMHYQENTSDLSKTDKMMAAIDAAINSMGNQRVMHSEYFDAQGEKHTTHCVARTHLMNVWKGNKNGNMPGLADIYKRISEAPDKYNKILGIVRDMIPCSTIYRADNTSAFM